MAPVLPVNSGGSTGLALPAVLTLSEATACEAQLRHAVQALAKGPVGQGGSGPVVVDASALLRFDSSALAVLLACRRACEASSKGFAVTGMVPRLQALVALYGVAELLPAA